MNKTFLIIVVFFISSCGVKRPVGVPESAIFITENWFELKEKISSDKYRIKVYSARYGEVRIDALFQIEGCHENLDSNNILSHVTYYDRNIYLTFKNKPNRVECYMSPIEIFEIQDSVKGRIELKEEIK